MAELCERYGADQIDAELIEGAGGIFDVVLDGEKIYSKHDTGRFPEYAEIPLAIDTRLVNQ